MQYGIRKGFEDVAHELKGIKNILASMWHSRYANGETDVLNPEAFADEYISTEECGRRLGVSDQTIRNWIAIGRKAPDKGWVEGIHYVNISPDHKRKAVIRIPWNMLVQSFAKNKETDLIDLRGRENVPDKLYQPRPFGRLE
jgi:hypothetical protein